MTGGSLLVGFLFAVVSSQGSPGPTCCQHIEEVHQSCRKACHQVSEETGTQQQLHQLAEVAQTCPHHLVSFWQCVNNTFAAVSSADVWSGLSCCGLPLVTQCQNSCKRARSRDDLGSVCQPNQELSFYSCLDRQEVSEQCCGAAVSAQCLAACKGVFLDDTLPREEVQNAVNENCNSHVIECVHNYTKAMPTLNPAESLPCCDRSDNMACRQGCRDILTTLTKEEEIMEELSKSCGPPSFTVSEPKTGGTGPNNLMDSMWQCFLIKSSRIRPKSHPQGTIETAGIDGAKLFCCRKATDSCRSLCVRTYTRGWTQSWTQFSTKCGSDPLEGDLNLCLEDVDERCELGCSGLDYCTNFNGRPTQLFRSCSSQADKAAFKDVQLWEDGLIALPEGTHIPVKSIRQCHPEMWKAIACILHVKPCHHQTHSTYICRSDCVRMLSECVDWPRLTPGHTADSLCTMLNAQDDKSPCIPVKDYLEPGQIAPGQREVTSPCRPNPCNDSQVCMINRRKCKHSHNCRPYVCKQACQLGEVSRFLVPQHTFVHILRTDSQRRSCYRVCQCNHHGMLSHCANLGCVRNKDNCHMATGRIESHMSQFKLNCHHCSCYAGELICDKRPCRPHVSPSSQEEHTFSGLPCNCGHTFVPVCGANGRTYPSGCIARCVGLDDSQFVRGTCEDRDPCDPNTCQVGTRCAPRHRMCLTLGPTECKQYECVPTTGDCKRHHRDPVCDTTGEEFSNLCILEQHGRTLAHRGHCLLGCRRTGIVCGHNGAHYSSECAAWGDGTLVDYVGHCRAVGFHVVGQENPVCMSVTCPPPPDVPCRRITPPGGCCPICGGVIRVLYSTSHTERAAREAQWMNPVTIHDVLTAVNQQLTIAECGVFSYLSIEQDLVIVIVPIVHQPTKLQYEACIQEAAKMGTLLAKSSPILVAHLPLHAVTAASTRTAVVGVSAAATSAPLQVSTLVMLTVISLWNHICAHR